MKMPKIPNYFIDTIKLLVRGGNGGMGFPKYKGTGGRGGSVYLKADQCTSLKSVLNKFSKRTIVAESGENSKPMKIFGDPGKDKIVKVPVGVIIYDQFMRKIETTLGPAVHEILNFGNIKPCLSMALSSRKYRKGAVTGELNNEGDELLVAEGGPGGSPNSKPPYSGSNGFSQSITIDLQLIADVGLVGFPNAGKSTLLKAISKAKPKIAAYAFTTLRPNLGVLEYPDFRQIKMADLPGLIEGASDNIGMGHKFLKHVERSSLLLLVVDVNGFQLTPNCFHRDCLETIIILNKELELYNTDLLDKPALIAINKMDLPMASSIFDKVSTGLKDLPGYVSRMPEELRPEKFLKIDAVVPISAKHDPDSIAKLKNIIRESVDKHFEFSLMDTMSELEKKLLKKIKQQNCELTKVNF